MKRIVVLASAVVLSLVATGVLLAQENPLVGTWKLNVAKSKFGGSAKAPQSETITVVAQGDGLKVTYEGIAADGSPISYSFTTNLDGKDSPISGTGPGDAVAITSVDANTQTGITKKAGTTISTWRSTVSKDGKVLTVIGKGMNPQGEPGTATTVYDKQGPKGVHQIKHL
jgi:hypothetical protein